jgi:hypothetical protein
MKNFLKEFIRIYVLILPISIIFIFYFNQNAINYFFYFFSVLIVCIYYIKIYYYLAIIFNKMKTLLKKITKKS